MRRTSRDGIGAAYIPRPHWCGVHPATALVRRTSRDGIDAAYIPRRHWCGVHPATLWSISVVAGFSPRLLPRTAHFVLARRFRAEQVTRKIIPSAAHHVWIVAETMVSVRQQQQIKILVRFDELTDDEQRVVRGNVVVHRAMREQQLALEILREILVRLIVVVRLAIGCAPEQSLPFLAPIIFIIAVVVVSGFGDAHLEEIRIPEHRIGSRVAAAGVSINSGAVYIDPRVLLGELFHSGYLVRQRVVAHVSEVGVMKLLGAPRRTHSIDLDDNETQLCE